MKRILITGIIKYEDKVRRSRLEKDKEFRPSHQPSGNSISKFQRKMMARQKCFSANSCKENTNSVV